MVGTIPEVVIMVTDRALDTWRQTGTVYAPKDARHHNLSDAFVLPGAYSAGREGKVQTSPTAMYLGIDTLGQEVYLELDSAGTGTATVQGGKILLGPAATLGVARLNDKTSADTSMAVWIDSGWSTKMVAGSDSSHRS